MKYVHTLIATVTFSLWIFVYRKSGLSQGWMMFSLASSLFLLSLSSFLRGESACGEILSYEQIVWVACAGIMCAFGNQSISKIVLSPMLIVVVMALVPVMTQIATWFAEKNVPTWKNLFGILLVAFGIYLVLQTKKIA